MKDKNICVNNHVPAIATNQSNQSIAELGCSFTKVIKNGRPALLACLNIQAQINATETLSSLLHHAEELNIRLPFLRVSVRVNTTEEDVSAASPQESYTQENYTQDSYLFVLHGLSRGSITPHTVSQLLNRLTHDFKIFLTYAQAHNIQVQPNLGTSAVKPFSLQ